MAFVDRFRPATWSTPQRLAGIAFLLGAVGLLGDPYGGGAVTVDTREMARIVHGEVDHVDAPELARWIVEGRSDFRLLDLRAPVDFAAYHIPGSENVPLAQLVDWGLDRNETIVLVSDGGIHSAQAWFLLAADGYAGARMLTGGVEAWKSEVLFPIVPDAPTTAERAELERLKSVAAYFGGTPRLASTLVAGTAGLPDVGAPSSGGTATAGAMPAMPVPVPVAPPVRPAGAKKKKEGC